MEIPENSNQKFIAKNACRGYKSYSLPGYRGNDQRVNKSIRVIGNYDHRTLCRNIFSPGDNNLLKKNGQGNLYNSLDSSIDHARICNVDCRIEKHLHLLAFVNNKQDAIIKASNLSMCKVLSFALGFP
jgi:hypothetical protein